MTQVHLVCFRALKLIDTDNESVVNPDARVLLEVRTHQGTSYMSNK